MGKPAPGLRIGAARSDVVHSDCGSIGPTRSPVCALLRCLGSIRAPFRKLGMAALLG